MSNVEKLVNGLVFLVGMTMIAIFVIGLIIVGLITDKVSGQDFDPCFIDNAMYKQICNQQDIDKLRDSLLEQWNSMDCSETQNYEQCDVKEYDDGFCQGNLTKMDRDLCNE